MQAHLIDAVEMEVGLLVDEMKNDLPTTGDQAGQQIEADNCSIMQKEDSFFIARSSTMEEL